VKSLVIFQGIAEVQNREVGVVMGVEEAVTAAEAVVDMAAVEGAQEYTKVHKREFISLDYVCVSQMECYM